MKSCISKIRELINKPILNSLLLKDHKNWNLMCGSIDTLESAQLAIDSYSCLNKDRVKDVGEHGTVEKLAIRRLRLLPPAFAGVAMT